MFASCDRALAFLRLKYNHIIDKRNIVPHPVVPTIDDGWTVVKRGRELNQRLHQISSQDGRYTDTKNETKRTVIISGQMGSGKTHSTLLDCVINLRKGVFKSVVYVGPRLVLVKSVGNIVKDLLQRKMNDLMQIDRFPRKLEPVVVRHYYTGGENDSSPENFTGGFFHICLCQFRRKTVEGKS